MTDLHAAIIDNPDDVNVRLVYADWLEENGEAEYASFIRVQCEIARIGKGNRNGLPEHDANSLDSLIALEASLMYGVWERGWCDPVPREWLSDSVIRRGFVEVIACRLADWIGRECKQCMGDGNDLAPPDHRRCPRCHGTGRTNANGPAIVRAAPIREVRFSDRRPDLEEEDGLWRWYAGYDATDAVPTVFCKDMMPSIRAFGITSLSDEAIFRTEADANRALSRAAIAWARG